MVAPTAANPIAPESFATSERANCAKLSLPLTAAAGRVGEGELRRFWSPFSLAYSDSFLARLSFCDTSRAALLAPSSPCFAARLYHSQAFLRFERTPSPNS